MKRLTFFLLILFASTLLAGEKCSRRVYYDKYGRRIPYRYNLHPDQYGTNPLPDHYRVGPGFYPGQHFRFGYGRIRQEPYIYFGYEFEF